MFIFGESFGTREAVFPPAINVEHINTLMSSLILIRGEEFGYDVLAYFACRLAIYLHKICKLAQVACKLGASDRSQGVKVFLAKT
jgi:hypothetical protein